MNKDHSSFYSYLKSLSKDLWSLKSGRPKWGKLIEIFVSQPKTQKDLAIFTSKGEGFYYLEAIGMKLLFVMESLVTGTI